MFSALAARSRSLLNRFWFVPSGIALALGALALLVVAIDRSTGRHGVDLAFGGDASAARLILSTIGASLITIAGLALSITIITLQLVSQQFTPRALRGFLKDRTNQVTIGAFVGIFLYCLLVLRAVRTETAEDQGFTPSLAVTVAILLGVVGLALLILFIHHISQTIQVSNLAAAIAKGTLRRVDHLYPQTFSQPSSEDPEQTLTSWFDGSEPARIFPARPGYIQTIDPDALVAALPKQRWRILIAPRPGDFVTEKDLLAAVWPEPDDGEEVARHVRRAITVENQRDVMHDVAYGIRQLADIAVRALSPGVNDPTTAIECLSYLRAIMQRLAERSLPPQLRDYDDGRVLVLARRRDFEDLLTEAFSEIALYGSDNGRVVAEVLDALASVAAVAREAGADARIEILHRMARTVAEAALQDARSEYHRMLIHTHIREIERVTQPVGNQP